MIQIRITPNERYSASEMGQMAVEGGCGWIVLSLPGAEPGEWRDIATDLVPLCREAGVIMTVEDNVAAVRELEAHGVYLHIGANAAAVREDLGPEAIVGAEIGAADAAVTLAKADIDYFTFSPQVTEPAAIIEAARKGGVEVPFVAVCSAAEIIENDKKYFADGYAGFYVTSGVFDTADPVAMVEQLVRRYNE